MKTTPLSLPVPLGIALLLGAAAGGLQANPAPDARALLPGVSIELVAEHPLLATPTGIDVDGEGRVWLVANHTHMPPDDYAGPKMDEILVFEPGGERRVFYLKTRDTMDLELGPDGWVYLAERGRILRIKDSSGDGQADTEETLVQLETEETYPHNGLAGLAWHPGGDLLFGLGENFAKPWTLTGADGASEAGRGEGGVFRCRPDGTGLRRVARGMWNPFGVCVREDGEIFAVDNDPGELPPCRLLHIVEGGDYGYQRQYGGEAHHPFVGWNGELRGSLPMITPSGEAPCAVLPLGRGLLAPSWSDHRVDFFPLVQQGASYGADRVTLVQGSHFFRPVGLAEDPASRHASRRIWYMTDWVDGRYAVHGFGRLWRLEIDLDAAAEWVGPLELEAPSEAALLAARLRGGEGELTEAELKELAADPDPFLARAALGRLARDHASRWEPRDLAAWLPEDRARGVVALSLANAEAASWIPALLDDPHPGVAFEALRWIADGDLRDHQAAVSALLRRSDLEFEVFEAAMAAWNTLSGAPEQGVRDTALLLERVQDRDSSPRLRAFALRLLPSQERTAPRSGPSSRTRFPEGLTVGLLEELLAEDDPGLSLEVVRALADNPRVGKNLLMAVAADPARPAELRAEATAGLAAVAEDDADLLAQLGGSETRILREEALRALRHRPLDGDAQEALRSVAERFPESGDLFAALLDPASLVRDRPAPSDTAAWERRLAAVDGEPDLDAGARVFHHASIALCANCHRHDGRGKIVGPDLSSVGTLGDSSWLLESILQPSLEIAPEYLPRAVTLKDGTVAMGIRLRSWVREQLRDAAGHTLSFDLEEVESIQELSLSLMPDGLAYALTDRELRDLLAFLQTSGAKRAP